VTAPAGTVALIVPSFTTLKTAAMLLWNLTAVTPVKPVPESVTAVPGVARARQDAGHEGTACPGIDREVPVREVEEDIADGLDLHPREGGAQSRGHGDGLGAVVGRARRQHVRERQAAVGRQRDLHARTAHWRVVGVVDVPGDALRRTHGPRPSAIRGRHLERTGGAVHRKRDQIGGGAAGARAVVAHGDAEVERSPYAGQLLRREQPADLVRRIVGVVEDIGQLGERARRVGRDLERPQDGPGRGGGIAGLILVGRIRVVRRPAVELAGIHLLPGIGQIGQISGIRIATNCGERERKY